MGDIALGGTLLAAAFGESTTSSGRSRGRGAGIELLDLGRFLAASAESVSRLYDPDACKIGLSGYSGSCIVRSAAGVGGADVPCMRASSGPAPAGLLLLVYRSSRDTGLPMRGVEKGLFDTSGVGEDGEMDRAPSRSCVLNVVLLLGTTPSSLVTPLVRVPVLLLRVGDSSSRILVAPRRRLLRRCAPSFQSLLALRVTSPTRDGRGEPDVRFDSRAAFRLCRSASSQRLRVCSVRPSRNGPVD